MRVPRRSAVIALTALGASMLVAQPAHAVTPTIRLASPVASWHVASTQHDGTNTSVHLAADVTGLTAVEQAGISVSFSAKPAGGTRTPIATDASAPYSTEWSPSPGTYDVTAEVLDGSGAVTATTTTTGVTVSSTASSVHLGSPTEGGLLGWYRPAGASAGYVAVSGTRSGDGPRVDVSLGTTWNASAVGTALASAGTPAWSAAAPYTPATAPTGDTAGTTVPAWVTAAAISGGATTSDEAVPVTLYLQRINAATSPSTVGGAKNSDIPVLVTVTDQFGRPIAGLPVTGTATGGATTVVGASTDATGVAQLTVRSTAAATSTITVSTKYGSAYDAAVDKQATVTLSTYTAVPTSLVMSANPAGPVLPVASYNTAAVSALVRDQYGVPLAGFAVNAKESVTRTTNGATSVKLTSSGAGLATTTDAQGRIALARDAAVNAAGTDVFDLYLELDGTAGRSTGDVGASTLTLQWATSQLTVDPCSAAACVSQQQIGNASTYTVREGLGGVASAGRTLALAVTSGVNAAFAPSQPGNTVRTSATAATCTTDAAGACQFTLVDLVAETAVVRATDTGPSGTSGAAAATLTVSVRTRSVALTNVAPLSTTVADPLGVPAGSVARPGAALIYRATARDVANQPLANTHVTVSVNHGFFTRNTSDGSASYGKLSFATVPVNGAAVTLPVNLGSSIDAVTDGAGVLTVTVSLGRDAALDANGVVSVVPSFTALGGSATAAAIGSFSTDAARLPTSPAGLRDPLNRDVQQPLTLTASVAGQLLSGFVPVNQTRSVQLWVRDSFGNLARPAAPLTLTLTGTGTLAATARIASYTGDLKPIVLSSTVAGTASLTASLTLPFTTFTVGGSTVGATSRGVVQSATAGPIQWYVPLATTASGATYTVTRTPSAAAYAVGTSVSFTLQARDQHQQPLKGLGVTIDRVGPGNVTPGHFSLATDVDGKVAYSLTGASQGNVQVTFAARDASAEVYRSVTSIGFDGVPTIAAPASRTGSGTVLIAGATRAGARVQLERLPFGSSTFVPVSTVTASAAGLYAFHPAIGRHTSYRVTVDGAVTSATVRVLVIDKPTLSLTTSSGSLTAHVSTSPSLRGAKVDFYRVTSDGVRHAAGTAITGTTGNAARTWKLKRGTVLTLIAYVHAVPGVSGHWTTKVSLRVR